MDENNEIHTKFFSLKVLTCIYDLQVGGDNVSGVTIDEIVEQMCRRFVTDGDVVAQVLISLKQICHKGLVGKIRERYKLVGPMARILLMTHRNCERQRQIEKIQRIFFHNCVGASSPQISHQNQKRSRSNKEDVPDRVKRSKTKAKKSSTIISKRSKQSSKLIIRDLVDFFQYYPSDSNLSSSQGSEPDIITILENKNCKSQSKSLCYSKDNFFSNK